MKPEAKNAALIVGVLAVLGAAVAWKLTRPAPSEDAPRTTAHAPDAGPATGGPVHGGVKKTDPPPDPLQQKLEAESKYLEGDSKIAQYTRDTRNLVANPVMLSQAAHGNEYAQRRQRLIANLQETFPLLVKMAKEDPQGLPRAFALSLLAPLKRAELQDLFLDRLTNDPFGGARHNAAQGLVTLGTPAAVDAVRAAAANDPDPTTRERIQGLLAEKR